MLCHHLNGETEENGELTTRLVGSTMMMTHSEIQQNISKAACNVVFIHFQERVYGMQKNLSVLAHSCHAHHAGLLVVFTRKNYSLLLCSGHAALVILIKSYVQAYSTVQNCHSPLSLIKLIKGGEELPPLYDIYYMKINSPSSK